MEDPSPRKPGLLSRRRHWIVGALVLFALAYVTAPVVTGQGLFAKRSIAFEGQVTDARSGEPLEGVFVLVGLQGSRGGFMSPHGHTGCMGGGAALRTDKGGRYRFSAKLSEVTKRPYPSSWGADIRLYKPGWRVEPFPYGRPISFLPETQTDFKMVPEPSFEARQKQTQLLFEGLCERGKVDRGWVAWHATVLEEVYAGYCSNDDLSFATFLTAQSWISGRVAAAREWQERPRRPSSSEQSDRAVAFQDSIRAVAPSYPWPYGLFHNAETSIRDFTAAEKKAVCSFLASQRLGPEK